MEDESQVSEQAVPSLSPGVDSEVEIASSDRQSAASVLGLALAATTTRRRRRTNRNQEE